MLHDDNIIAVGPGQKRNPDYCGNCNHGIWPARHHDGCRPPSDTCDACSIGRQSGLLSIFKIWIFQLNVLMKVDLDICPFRGNVIKGREKC